MLQLEEAKNQTIKIALLLQYDSDSMFVYVVGMNAWLAKQQAIIAALARKATADGRNLGNGSLSPGLPHSLDSQGGKTH